jgi:hypothetical protein
MAPIGVMSVSPVALAATMERKKVTSTARIPIHQVMSNSQWPRTTQAAPDASVPTTNQLDGTSTRAIGSSWPSVEPPTRRPRPPKARSTVFHLRPKESRPDDTIIAVDGQSTHDTMPR